MIPLLGVNIYTVKIDIDLRINRKKKSHKMDNFRNDSTFILSYSKTPKQLG